MQTSPEMCNTEAMSTPPAIGPVHYSEPRAVQVRNPDNLSEFHSAIHGSVAVYVDNKNQANAVMLAWANCISKFADEVIEIIEATKPQEEENAPS